MNLVKSKLDPESLGIILLGPFLLEFFPDQVRNLTNTVRLRVCVFVCVPSRTTAAHREKKKCRNGSFYEGRDREKLC